MDNGPIALLLEVFSSREKIRLKSDWKWSGSNFPLATSLRATRWSTTDKERRGNPLEEKRTGPWARRCRTGSDWFCALTGRRKTSCCDGRRRWHALSHPKYPAVVVEPRKKRGCEPTFPCNTNLNLIRIKNITFKVVLRKQIGARELGLHVCFEVAICPQVLPWFQVVHNQLLAIKFTRPKIVQTLKQD